MKKLISASASIAGPISLVAGLVSDFLSPLAPFSKYVFLTSLACTTIFLIIFYIQKKSGKIQDIESGFVFKGLSFSIISSCVFGLMFLLNQFNPDKGVIASSIPSVSSFQNSLLQIEQGLNRVENKIEELDGKLDDKFSNIENAIKQSNPIENPKTPNDFIINAYLYKASGNLLKSEESFRAFITETRLEKYDLLKDYFDVLMTNYGIDKAVDILVGTSNSAIAMAIIAESQFSGSELQIKLIELNNLDTLLRNWIETKNYKLSPGMIMSQENIMRSHVMIKKEQSLGDKFVNIQPYFLNKLNCAAMWNNEWKSSNKTPQRQSLSYCHTYYNQLKEAYSNLDSTSGLKKMYPTVNQFVDNALERMLKLDNKAKAIWWHYANNPIEAETNQFSK